MESEIGSLREAAEAESEDNGALHAQLADMRASRSATGMHVGAVSDDVRLRSAALRRLCRRASRVPLR
jgi:hypothetical protein